MPVLRKLVPMAGSDMRGFLPLAAVLGLLAAIGPAGIDIFLPALPDMARDLSIGPSSAQMVLAIYFVALGAGQCVYGPWSDQCGRRRPLMTGLGIFVLGSIGCAVAPSFEFLLACRVVQALGAAAAMVIPRAMIRDRCAGVAATRLMGLVLVTMSVAPMLAPLAGGALLALTDWRWVFAGLALVGLWSLALTRATLAETLPPVERVKVSSANLRHGVARLLRDRVFVGLTLVSSFASAGYFVFLSQAGFVLSNGFGLGHLGVGLVLALTAAGFVAVAQAAAWATSRLGVLNALTLGAALHVATHLCLAALARGPGSGLPETVLMFALGNAAMGLVVPSAMARALDRQGPVAGLAAAMSGSAQLLIGGIVIALAAPLTDGRVETLAILVASCGAMAGISGLVVLPWQGHTAVIR